MKGKTVRSYFNDLAIIAAGDGKEVYNGVHADKDIFCGMDKALEMAEDGDDFSPEGIPASGVM